MSLIRCPWSQGVSDEYERYHDHEWGVPVHDDIKHFEFLILEGAQAGLSWSTVLHKRPAYRKAYAGFDPEKVARFNRLSVERLLNNAAIIRNRSKIECSISNARCFVEVQSEFGSFDDYIWAFVDGKPVVNRWKRDRQVPATSTESDALSKDLKARGFKFVGSTTIYAHMQAIGLVNDHLVDCFRHEQCRQLTA
jgi:DNA-3-methyladenine glycosylase I